MDGKGYSSLTALWAGQFMNTHCVVPVYKSIHTHSSLFSAVKTRRVMPLCLHADQFLSLFLSSTAATFLATYNFEVCIGILCCHDNTPSNYAPSLEGIHERGREEVISAVSQNEFQNN